MLTFMLIHEVIRNMSNVTSGKSVQKFRKQLIHPSTRSFKFKNLVYLRRIAWICKDCFEIMK